MNTQGQMNMFHVQIWVAAIFCSVYVAMRVFYLLVPITYWAVIYDVYPVETEVKINTPIMFISHMQQKRMTDYKYIDTLFCRKSADEDFIRYTQQITETFAEPADIEQKYLWPMTTGGVAYPAECYVNTSMRVTLPLGNTKAIKLNGLKNNHTFFVTE